MTSIATARAGRAPPVGCLVELEAGQEPDPGDVRARIERHGFVRLRGVRHVLAAAGATASASLPDGYRLVERLVGERPEVVEVQVLLPIPGARSFAASSVETPLHTDSQDLLGVAPTLQVLVAARPAASGGETTLLDTHEVLDDVARADDALLRALFEEVRTIPFYFGPIVGPTVALKRGHLVVTHAPLPPSDAVGRALAPFVAARPPTVVPLAPGDVLLVDNHRMLHGRNAFDDPDRRLVRALAWLGRPLGVHPALRARAASLAGDADRELTPLPSELRAVIDLLAGVGPAVIAAREGIPEATLYAWRNAALAAAQHALRHEPRR